MREVFNRWLAIGLLASLAISGTAYAGPYGYDLHNVLAPRSAGMAGTSIAKPLDNVSAIFGNPAALTDWTGTEFTFGATYYKPEVRLDHAGGLGLPTYAGSVPQATLDLPAVAPNDVVPGVALGCNSAEGFCITDSYFDDAVNGNEGYIVPQVGVTQDLRPLGLPAVLGAGLTAVSGIGVEFRHVEETLGLGAEFIVLGANFALGWELNEKVSIGGAATITYAYLDLGLAATSGVTHDTGMRGTLGITYEDIVPGTRLGLFYMTELQHVFDDIVAVPAFDHQDYEREGHSAAALDGYGAQGPVRYASIPIEEPRTLGIGISNETFMDGNLLIAADVMWKNWEEADFWGDVYEDQMVYSVGAQMKMGNWRFRAGYGYADDPTDRDADHIKGLPAVCSSATNCNVIPIGSPDGSPLLLGQSVLEFLQASQTEVIYRHRATLGVGYMGFLAPFLNIDGHVGVQFKERNHYSAGTPPLNATTHPAAPLATATTTAADVWSWHAGFALTWNFQY